MSLKLYDSHTWIWPLLSPPEDYEEEATIYRDLLFAQRISEGSTLLHLGSGGGSLDWWFKRWFQVTGVDLSESMIAHAQTVNPEVEYVQGDLQNVGSSRGIQETVEKSSNQNATEDSARP